MKRETYVKRLITSYSNLSKDEKNMFLNKLHNIIKEDLNRIEDEQIENQS